MAGISQFSGMVGVRDKISDYIHPSLTKIAFLNTYSNMIHNIPDQSWWLQVAAAYVIPPPIIRQPGRPKFQRKRESGEKPRETRSGSDKLVSKGVNSGWRVVLGSTSNTTQLIVGQPEHDMIIIRVKPPQPKHDYD
ncbi:hypothetical protein Dsin_029564 [Dipteronia sinensis]|uniref:Uncharacterized protein n=1 Tax=Dipteronia sinensis TaxID=43782 RepID=A0AAD9ZSJ6_9ROSI|nr:hypothetical protein Dsin_029564 [Dipteronia sinensis]